MCHVNLPPIYCGPCLPIYSAYNLFPSPSPLNREITGGGRALTGWNICQLLPGGGVGPEGTLPVSVRALTGKKLAKNGLNLVKIAEN